MRTPTIGVTWGFQEKITQVTPPPPPPPPVIIEEITPEPTGGGVKEEINLPPPPSKPSTATIPNIPPGYSYTRTVCDGEINLGPFKGCMNEFSGFTGFAWVAAIAGLMFFWKWLGWYFKNKNGNPRDTSSAS